MGFSVVPNNNAGCLGKAAKGIGSSSLETPTCFQPCDSGNSIFQKKNQDLQHSICKVTREEDSYSACKQFRFYMNKFILQSCSQDQDRLHQKAAIAMLCAVRRRVAVACCVKLGI